MGGEEVAWQRYGDVMLMHVHLYTVYRIPIEMVRTSRDSRRPAQKLIKVEEMYVDGVVLNELCVEYLAVTGYPLTQESTVRVKTSTRSTANVTYNFYNDSYLSYPLVFHRSIPPQPSRPRTNERSDVSNLIPCVQRIGEC